MKYWDSFLMKDLVGIKFSDDSTLISLMPKFRIKLDTMINSCRGEVKEVGIDEYYLSDKYATIEYRATIIYEQDGIKKHKEEIIEVD